MLIFLGCSHLKKKGQRTKGLRPITCCAPLWRSSLKVIYRAHAFKTLTIKNPSREVKKELQYTDLFHTDFHSSQKAGFFIALHAQVQKKTSFSSRVLSTFRSCRQRFNQKITEMSLNLKCCHMISSIFLQSLGKMKMRKAASSLPYWNLRYHALA